MQIEELCHNGHKWTFACREDSLSAAELDGDMTGRETRLLTSQLRKTCLRKHLSDDVEKLSGSAFVTATDIKCNHVYIDHFFKLINKTKIIDVCFRKYF